MAEAIVYVPHTQHAEIFEIINRRFRIPTLDLAAASHFARTPHEKMEGQGFRKIKEEIEASRAQIKADAQIVSIAVTQGANCVVTHDGAMQTYAREIIETKQMDDFDFQRSLPFSDEES